MDAIRAALGDEKLNYLGYSYGTLLGAVYAQLFPTKIRAMVLDGAVDPQQSPVESSEGQAMGFERALNNFSAWCKAERHAAARSPPTPRGAIEQRDRSGPDQPGDGRRRPQGDGGLGVLRGGVLAVLRGRPGPTWPGPSPTSPRATRRVMFLLADSYAERDENGDYSNLFDANNAVNCADTATTRRSSRSATCRRSGGPSTRCSARRWRSGC